MRDNSKLIRKLDDVNARGQITNETFGNGVESEREYDENWYLKGIVTGANGNIQDLEYIYNTKGQMYRHYPSKPPPRIEGGFGSE